MTSLQKSAENLRQWVTEQALPIWSERAHRPDGSWVEHLHLDGTADMASERRWRVMARQVYVYAQATKLGWHDGLAVAEMTHAEMCGTGYVHRVDADGEITNDMRDLYDHAFYVLAAASLYGLTGAPDYLGEAEMLLNWIDRELAHPKGGWRESDQVGDAAPRRQNPHMHLLEASLYLHSVTGEAKHLRYAKDVFKLFKAHFYDSGTISEFFSANWTLAEGSHGQTAEPGHAVEWIWLLGQYGKATGVDVRHYQTALYNRALRERDIFLNDEEDKSGNIRHETKRLWVQTEVIKAHLAMAEIGTSGSADLAAATIDALFPTYLTSNGLWNDQINACGANIAATIPVSTFYHILCMAAEAERVANTLS